MRRRLFILIVATFGLPVLWLGAEVVAWLSHAPTITETLLKYVPDVFRLLLMLWFLGIAYCSGRVVWLVTETIAPWFIRTTARAFGTIVLVIVLFLAGGFVLSTWLPTITVRSVTPAQ